MNKIVKLLLSDLEADQELALVLMNAPKNRAVKKDIQNIAKYVCRRGWNVLPRFNKFADIFGILYTKVLDKQTRDDYQYLSNKGIGSYTDRGLFYNQAVESYKRLMKK